jgi:tetratricopeptide (TPR) repeat protein
VASFDKAIELDPANVQAWFHRGWMLNNLRRYDAAVASFDEVIKRTPNDADVWFHRGWTLNNLGRYDEALIAYDKAIELKPNNARAWSGRGAVFGNLGRYDEALASCNKAIELGDQFPNVFFNRSEALLALNRWDEGYAALDDVLGRFAHSPQPAMGDTGTIVRNLFTRIGDATMWQAHITTLLELYAKHKVLPALAQGLVRSISVLTSPMISNAAVCRWRDQWQACVGGRTEFQLPLRLLDVAVRYRETNDPRVLLELPIEERTVVEELLHEVKEAR